MNKRISQLTRVLPTLAVCAVFLSCGFFARAEDSLSDQKSDLKGDLIELQKKADSYQNIVDLKANQAAVLNSQINSLDNQTQEIESNIDQNKGDIDTLRENIRKTEWRIDEQEKLINERREILAKMIRSYYDRSAFTDTQLLLGSDKTENIFAAVDQKDQLQKKIGESARELLSLKSSLEKDKESFEEESTKLKELNAKLEQQTTYLENTKHQKEDTLSETQYEQKKYENKLSDVQEKIKDIEEEIQSLEARLSQGLDLKDIPKAEHGLLDYPVDDVHITQKYGKTTFTRYYTFHNGVDFGVPSGTKVRAAGDGKVIATGNSGNYAYGKWIAIDHGDGLVTLYGHLSSVDVGKGDKVDKGDKIGKSGNTGYSTGPHLHFSVFSEKTFEVVDSSTVSGVKVPVGASVDPMWYLP